MNFTSISPVIPPETLSHIWIAVVGGASVIWLIWLWGFWHSKIAAGMLLTMTGGVAFLFYLVPVYQWLPTMICGIFLIIAGIIQLPNNEAKQ